jgi:hypothetical protein
LLDLLLFQKPIFSKELVAYLRTLITLSFFQRSDDCSMSGKMEHFYTQALTSYKDYQYSEFHKYIIRNMRDWYRNFPFATIVDDAEDDSGCPKEGDIVSVPVATDACPKPIQCPVERRRKMTPPPPPRTAPPPPKPLPLTVPQLPQTALEPTTSYVMSYVRHSTRRS